MVYVTLTHDNTASLVHPESIHFVVDSSSAIGSHLHCTVLAGRTVQELASSLDFWLPVMRLLEGQELVQAEVGQLVEMFCCECAAVLDVSLIGQYMPPRRWLPGGTDTVASDTYRPEDRPVMVLHIFVPIEHVLHRRRIVPLCRSVCELSVKCASTHASLNMGAYRSNKAAISALRSGDDPSVVCVVFGFGLEFGAANTACGTSPSRGSAAASHGVQRTNAKIDSRI